MTLRDDTFRKTVWVLRGRQLHVRMCGKLAHVRFDPL